MQPTGVSVVESRVFAVVIFETLRGIICALLVLVFAFFPDALAGVSCRNFAKLSTHCLRTSFVLFFFPLRPIEDF